MFYITSGHIDEIQVSGQRMSTVEFKNTYPNATHAFAENWNLHNTHTDYGRGHLLVVKTKDNINHLCITLMRNKTIGIYEMVREYIYIQEEEFYWFTFEYNTQAL